MSIQMNFDKFIISFGAPNGASVACTIAGRDVQYVVQHAREMNRLDDKIFNLFVDMNKNFTGK